ncbi:MAG: hypothetical protein ACOYXM_09320 [Actinomycetota bacterium]
MSEAETSGPSAQRENDQIARAIALLREAEGIAEGARDEAERYLQQRRLEADLLIQKARRVLLAAEAKAAVIVATAREAAPLVRDGVIDLDAISHIIAPGAAVLSDGSVPTALDRLLESAIAHAVTDAFPAGGPA